MALETGQSGIPAHSRNDGWFLQSIKRITVARNPAGFGVNQIK